MASEVPLSLFGGLLTELAPCDLPEGLSPDNWDMAFLPGSTFTRPPVRKLYSTFAAPILYQRTYVQPNGSPLNLFLLANGQLLVEDPVLSPGAFTLLANVPPDTRALSTTAFGREYIALSDGLHGSETALQYDGEFLDRVSQDGPGSAPNVSSVILAALAMDVSGATAVLNVSEADPANQNGTGGNYTSIHIFVDSVVGVSPGATITIAGNTSSAMNGTYHVTAVYPGAPGLVIANATFPPGTALGFGGTGTIASGVTTQRSNNIVTVNTHRPHLLQPGFQVHITNMPASIVGGAIASVSIHNEDEPGVATITTTLPHDLVPGIFVSLTGIGVAAQYNIASIVRTGGIVTVQTVQPSNMVPGSAITIALVADGTLNTDTVVSQVLGTNSFTYFQQGELDVNYPVGTGVVYPIWPITNAPTPTFFEVTAVPDDKSFQIAINYADGQWGGGNVSFGWDGTFFVTNVLSATQFQYQQYGPDATSTIAGTVTPFGQASPGVHQAQLAFLTRQGYLTKPSPPVQFIANGGQYISVSNMAIGPPNVIARVLCFTGASGSFFFYIPVPSFVDGQQVSTATQINDNISSYVVLDFSDKSLFEASGINIPGNNLPEQVVLDPALGVYSYASRLFWWGTRSKIENLLNMGFEGGSLPSSPTLPTGWTPVDLEGSALALGHFGVVWSCTIPTLDTSPEMCGTLQQSFYQDYRGAPIGQPNTQYSFRFWAKISFPDPSMSYQAIISSALGVFTITAAINGSQLSTTGAWFEIPFSGKTPLTLPPDTVLTISSIAVTGVIPGITLQVDDLEIIYTDTPFLEEARVSYVRNPEAFDGETGTIGPESDQTGIVNQFAIRDTLYLLTAKRLYQTVDQADAEPSSWSVRQVAAECGALSAFGTDSGEDWAIWASISGLRGFSGGEPGKLSQEIQTLWDQMNPAAARNLWVKNDPIARRIYVGVPIGTQTFPGQTWTLDYRESDTMGEIASKAPLRVALSGRMIAMDMGRKWSIWRLPMNCAATLSHAGQSVFCFGGGSNCYLLDATRFTDDDFGQINWSYTTYAFLGPDSEQNYRVGSQRKLYSGLRIYATGIGSVTVTPLVDALVNPRRTRPYQPLAANPGQDLSWSLNVTGERLFFRFTGLPAAGTTDSYINMQKLMARIAQHPVSPSRGCV